MHIKDFEEWGKLKQELHNKIGKLHLFNEREIWWCSIGINIGDEEDGKNQMYNRPVLILKKFNNRIFWGVPLSTKIKNDKSYFLIDIKGKNQSVLLSHLRLYDSKRLHSKPMHKITVNQFKEVKTALRNLL